MGRSLVFCLFILLCVNTIYSQSLGLIEDEDLYNTLEKFQFENIGQKNESFSKSKTLKKFVPFSKNQGKINSCSSWAVVYGAMSIDHAIRNDLDNRKVITEQSFMPLSAHNYTVETTGDCKRAKGTKIVDVLEFVKTEGVLHYSDFNVNPEDCDTLLPQILEGSFQKRRIKDFYKLFDKDDKTLKVFSVKKALSNDMPVIIGFQVLKSFRDVRRGTEIWRPKRKDKIRGMHAMVVVGYDDGTETFELFNSWGTQWGKGGFIKVGYEEFKKYCKSGFVFINEEDGVSANISSLNNFKWVSIDFLNVDHTSKRDSKKKLLHKDKFLISIKSNHKEGNFYLISCQDEKLSILQNKMSFDIEKHIFPNDGYAFSFNDKLKSKLILIESNGEIHNYNNLNQLLSFVKKYNYHMINTDYDGHLDIIELENNRDNLIIINLN